MKIDLETLRNIKGIGKKTLENIINEQTKINSGDFLNKYLPELHINSSSLIHGDMFEKMNGIPDKSIDMILTDLPYGTTQNKWDSVIPLDKVWQQYNRVIKDNGVIVLFSQGKFTSKLIQSNPTNYRYDLIWEKDRPSGFLNASKMPLRSHEHILIFYKNTPTYNPIMWEGKPLHGMGKKYTEGLLGNNNYGKFNSHLNPSAEREGDTQKYPRSVLKFSRPHPPIHPTQKPVELLEYLIQTYTNKGDLVLDSTMGSGSTCIACINTNREYIGIELEEEYYNIATKRVQELLNMKEKEN